MMEELIKRPATLARYLESPLAEERDSFLKHCAQVGYTPSMLQKVSWIIWTLRANYPVIVVTIWGDFCSGRTVTAFFRLIG